MRVYITIEDVLALHQDQIDTYGGASGVRDFGLLESAVARPSSGYYADEFEEAAALWESLAQNHPFVDGNKRAAFASVHSFLLVNGWDISADSLTTYNFINGLFEKGEFKYNHLLEWLRANTQAL